MLTITEDPVLRKKYDDQGNEAVADDADQYTKLDPTLFFSLLFGSEKFEPYVGEFLLVRKISTLFNTMQGPDQEVDISQVIYDKDGDQKQRMREIQCAINLLEKIDPFVEKGEEKKMLQQLEQEAQELAESGF